MKQTGWQHIQVVTERLNHTYNMLSKEASGTKPGDLRWYMENASENFPEAQGKAS